MARKPVKTKESGKARPGGKIPAYIRDAVADPEIAAALKAMLKNVGFTDFDAAAGDDEKSAVALLEELLAPDTKPVEGDETLADRLEHLELALTDMTVAANGGDPDARAERDGVYGLLDAAVARGTVGPVRMLSLSQTLATAGLRVPESMRAAIGAAFARLPPEAIDAMALNAFAPLFANLAESGGSAFDLHQGLSEMLEGFPDALRIELACALVRAGDDLDKDLRMAAAGFLLHPDPALANAIAAALAASASRKPVESLLVERMVRMRGWLAADRLAGVDAAVQALRRNAKAAVAPEAFKPVKLYGSAFDGSGTGTLLATVRQGSRHCLATVLLKHDGVVDAMVMRDMSKHQIDRYISQLKSQMSISEIGLPGLSRLLGLALGRNQATGTGVPFALVAVTEALGLGPLHPESATVAQLLDALLAGINSAGLRTDRAVAGEISETWYEAGADIETLLLPLKTRKQRIDRLLELHLPARRDHWALQCALSAMVLKGQVRAADDRWLPLALAGRDIASGVALAKIPLMLTIAAQTVDYFRTAS